MVPPHIPRAVVRFKLVCFNATLNEHAVNHVLRSAFALKELVVDGPLFSIQAMDALSGLRSGNRHGAIPSDQHLALRHVPVPSRTPWSNVLAPLRNLQHLEMGIHLETSVPLPSVAGSVLDLVDMHPL